MSEFSLGAAELGTAVDLAGLKKGIDQGKADAQSGFGAIGDIIGGAVKVGLAAAAAGIAATGAIIASGISDAREAAKIMGQTEAVIKSTGSAAGRTADQIADLATSLSAASGKSLVGDDAVHEAENLLLTFTEIKGSVFDAATAISVDMAQALGGAPRDQAIQLGKALNDPVKGVTALSRVGVTFTEQQKTQIKTMADAGDMMGAQKIILAELNKEFGGSAEAAARADGGWAQFNDRLGEAKEAIGTALLPVLNQLFGFLNDTVAPVVEAAAVKFGELVTAFQTGAEGGDFLGGIINALYTLEGVSPVFTTIGDGLAVLGDWLGVQIPIAVQTASDIWNTTLLPAITQVSDYFQTTILPVLENLATAVLPILGAALQVLAGLWTDVLQPALLTAWNILTTFVVPILADVANWLAINLPPAIQVVADFLTGTLFPALHTAFDYINTNVVPVLGVVVQWLRDNIPPAIQTAADFWNNTLWPALQKVWAFIQDNVIPVVQRIANEVFPALNAKTEEASKFWNETLYPALHAVWEFIDTKLIPLFSAIGNVLDAVVRPATDAYIQQLNTGLMPGLHIVGDFISQNLVPDLTNVKTGFDTITSALGITGPKLQSFGNDILSGVAGWFKQIGDGITLVTGYLNTLAEKLRSVQVPPWLQGHSPPPMAEWFDYISAAVLGVAGDALPQFQSALSGVTNGGVADLSNVNKELIATLTGVGANVYDTTDNFREMLQQLGFTWEETNRVDDALHQLGAAYQDTGAGSVEVGEAMDALGEALGLTHEQTLALNLEFNKLVAGASGAATGIANAGDQASQSWIDAVDQLAKQFSNSDLPGDASDLGDEIMAGWAEGMDNAFDDLLGQVNKMSEKLKNEMDKAWDVESPSGVTEDLGANIMLGLLGGLEDTLPEVMAAVQRATGELQIRLGEIGELLKGKLTDDARAALEAERDLIEEHINAITDALADLPDKVHAAIADALDAGADLDRQLAKNMADVAKLKYGESAQNRLDKALEDSKKKFSDPEEQAKYFQMRSRQILEEAKLYEEMDKARAAGDDEKAAALQEQLRLIQEANKKEQEAFEERSQISNSGSLSSLHDLIEQITSNLVDPGSGPIHDMLAFLSQLQMQIDAVASGQPLPGQPTTPAPTPPPTTQPTPPPPTGPPPTLPEPPPMGTTGLMGDRPTISIAIDARGAGDPRAVEDAGYRGAKRALEEAGMRADIYQRTRR